jgi:hypothetical protein
VEFYTLSLHPPSWRGITSAQGQAEKGDGGEKLTVLQLVKKFPTFYGT